jgi:predicted PurR-regulated permease PerM
VKDNQPINDHLAAFFAIVGGVVQFGTAGVILGPLILAVTLSLFDGRTADSPLQVVDRQSRVITTAPAASSPRT